MATRDGQKRGQHRRGEVAEEEEEEEAVAEEEEGKEEEEVDTKVATEVGMR